MCGVVFGLDCARHARSVSSYLSWTLPIPEDPRGRSKDSSEAYRYRVRRSKEYATTEPPLKTNESLSQESHSKYPISVVQITDIHIDPYYEGGSNADCGEPLCCRASSPGHPNSKSKIAGIWGDYRNCDTPVSSLKSALEHISLTHPEVSYPFYSLEYHNTVTDVELSWQLQS